MSDAMIATLAGFFIAGAAAGGALVWLLLRTGRAARAQERTHVLEQEMARRRQAEEAVAAERQRLNDVLELLPAYVVLLDADYRVPFANRFFRERFGESRGRRCYEYLFGRTEPCEVCHSYEALKTLEPVRWEWLGPDGRNYDIYDFPFADAGGATLILEMGIDITERKQAEQALQSLNETLERRVAERTAALAASEARYHSLFSSMTEGFALHEIILDAEGVPRDYRFLEINPAFEVLTGLKREDVIGRAVSEVLPGLEPYWVEIYSRVALTGEPVRFDNYAAVLRRYYEVLAYSPAPRQFAAVFLDVTNRKAAEAERERLLARQQEMLRTISHDLRTPLTVVLGEAQRAQRHADRADVVRKSAEHIAATARRMNSMAQDLVDAARVEAGQIRVEAVPINLTQYAFELKDRLSAAGSAAERLQVDIPAELPLVLADPNHLERILGNLVGNALQYSPPETPVIVSAAEQDDGVIVSVADQGPGLTADDQSRVFQPYFRGAAGQSRKEGLGLGLAITKGLVEAHGGRVWAESEPGRGSTFRFTLRRA